MASVLTYLAPIILVVLVAAGAAIMLCAVVLPRRLARMANQLKDIAETTQRIEQMLSDAR